MDSIANAILWLAVAVLMHGCLNNEVVRVYVDGVLQEQSHDQ